MYTLSVETVPKLNQFGNQSVKLAYFAAYAIVWVPKFELWTTETKPNNKTVHSLLAHLRFSRCHRLKSRTCWNIVQSSHDRPLLQACTALTVL
jgi:hypothetical protein